MNLWDKILGLFGLSKSPAPQEPKQPETEGKQAATSMPVERPKPPRPPKQPPVVKKHDPERLTRILLSARMSEKSVQAAEHGQHVFEVVKGATRDEVKSAVESMFDVKVDSVRMINMRGKSKRRGRRDDWSKAYVRLQPGQNLERGELGA